MVYFISVIAIGMPNRLTAGY